MVRRGVLLCTAAATAPWCEPRALSIGCRRQILVVDDKLRALKINFLNFSFQKGCREKEKYVGNRVL
jgi:hypothetical protein